MVQDDNARTGAVIEQSSNDATEDRYPLAVYEAASLKDVDVSADIKIVSGNVPSAGLVARLLDCANYYLVSMNALEGRVDLYSVVAGQRERVAGTDADVVRDHWQTLRVAVEGDEVSVSLDGRLLFKAWDHALAKEGHVALWTGEDTVARFDHVEVTPHPWSEKD